MKGRILFLIAACLAGCSPRQTLTLIPSDSRDSGPEGHYRSVDVKMNPYQVKLVTISGKKETRPANEVWGYKDAKGHRYRLYRGVIYEVLQEKQVTIYRESSFGEVWRNNYYYSLTPEGELFYLNRKNLGISFAGNACVQKLLEEMPSRSWLEVTGSGNYRLVDACEGCGK